MALSVTCEVLKSNPLLEDVPDDQIDWLLNNSECHTIKVGDYIFEKGDPIDKLIIIIEGELEIKFIQGNTYKVFDRLGPGSITGYLPYSRATTAVGYGEVVKEVTAVIFPKKRARELTSLHYELTKALVNQMTTRTREFTRSNYQDEKLMALGKLSAGLAHELNNPAAAMISSAKEMKKQLGTVPEKFKNLMMLDATPEEVEKINDILFGRLGADLPKMSLVERGDLEEEIEEWLEDHGVEDAYLLAETLADFQMSPDLLEKIYEAAREKNFPAAITWIENVLVTEKIIDEIVEAADRISGLVTSIKGYTHMDRGQEKSPMVIEESILNTLKLLKHKSKRKKINIEVSIPDDFPKPNVMIGQLNQVWTNILDNAIDASPPDGIISINGNIVGDFLRVSIVDRGHGISPENLNKIFDPFFTTKKLGEGTGLGLDVSYRIVKQHLGDIKVESEKGRTQFDIYLPINK